MRKTRSEQSRVFRGMDNRMKEMGDNNACGVIAIAIAFGITYQEAFEEYEFVGRRKGFGVSSFQIKLVANRLASRMNVKAKEVKHVDKLKQVLGVSPTINNIPRVLSKSCNYLIITRDHVVAYKRGRIHDWAEGRKLQVLQMIEIESNI